MVTFSPISFVDSTICYAASTLQKCITWCPTRHRLYVLWSRQ